MTEVFRAVFLTRAVLWYNLCAHFYSCYSICAPCGNSTSHAKTLLYTGWGDCVCDVQGTRRVWVLLLFAGKKNVNVSAACIMI